MKANVLFLKQLACASAMISGLAISAQGGLIAVGNTTTDFDFTSAPVVAHAVDASSNLLVVTLSGKAQAPGSATSFASSVSYDGVEMTRAAYGGQSSSASNLFMVSETWYLLSPTVSTSADIAVTLDSGWSIGTTQGRGIDVMAIDFSGVQAFDDGDSFGTTSSSQSAHVASFTLSQPGEEILLIGALAHNNGDSNEKLATPDSGVSVYTNTPGDSRGTGGGYELLDSASNPQTWALDWDDPDRYAFSGAAFTAVPEPSTVAFLLGGIALSIALMRRRKQN